MNLCLTRPESSSIDDESWRSWGLGPAADPDADGDDSSEQGLEKVRQRRHGPPTPLSGWHRALYRRHRSHALGALPSADPAGGMVGVSDRRHASLVESLPGRVLVDNAVEWVRDARRSRAAGRGSGTGKPGNGAAERRFFVASHARTETAANNNFSHGKKLLSKGKCKSTRPSWRG